jgi:hypothetical protein
MAKIPVFSVPRNHKKQQKNTKKHCFCSIFAIPRYGKDRGFLAFYIFHENREKREKWEKSLSFPYLENSKKDLK